MILGKVKTRTFRGIQNWKVQFTVLKIILRGEQRVVKFR